MAEGPLDDEQRDHLTFQESHPMTDTDARKANMQSEIEALNAGGKHLNRTPDL